ncbi:MAG: hypothetical protein WA133_02665 [Syntrophales bacterium]
MSIADEPTGVFDTRASWSKLIEIHNHAKSVFLLAEEFDPESKDFIQPAMELRHGLEHIIRAQAAILDINSGESHKDPDYIEHSFDKAIGHEYRAFFDAADWLSVSIRKRIIETLDVYSHKCIAAVIPEYYPKLRPSVDQCCREIAKIRGAKDVARNSDIEVIVGKSNEAIAEVGRYRKVISDLLDIDEKIHDSIPALIDWKEKNRRGAFYKWILSNLVGGLIIAVITAWIIIRMGLSKP